MNRVKFPPSRRAMYEHDCDSCVFLGRYKHFDLYFCAHEPTVIARYGRDGKYHSGICFAGVMICFAGVIPALGCALKRAIRRDLISTARAFKYGNPWDFAGHGFRGMY